MFGRKRVKTVSAIDSPRPLESVYSKAVMISGWLYDPEHPAVCTIRARVDGNTIGESRLLFVRQDVCDSLGIAPDFPTGFRLLAQIQDEITGPRNIIIAITAQWHPEGVEDEISSVMVKMLPSLLDTNPYGDVLAPTQAIVLHRPNIYGSGPPVEDANPDMVKLILQYLPPGAIVADIGCGAGAYGPPLLEAGHGWLGMEVNPVCVKRLAERGLPHRLVATTDGKLPCDDLEFDSAICIEVLEHIEHFDAFLAEVARIVRTKVIFSVPNMEVIPYFSTWQLLPWHLLELDHKNFFTRTSLRQLLLRHFNHAEVSSYGIHPMSTLAGVTLHNHLVAVAVK